jgi:hypothetical protein
MNEAVDTLAKHVEELNKLQGFILKTKDKSGKFSETVIARLIIEFESKQDDVKEEAYPLVSQLKERSEILRGELDQLKNNNSGQDDQKQELELRLEIGAISQLDFDAQMNSIRSSLVGFEKECSEFEEELHHISQVLDGWKNYDDGFQIQKEVPQRVVVDEEIKEEREVVPEVTPPLEMIPEEIEEVDEEIEQLADDLPPVPDVLGELESGFEVDLPQVDVTFDKADSFEIDEDQPYEMSAEEELKFDLSDDNFGFEDSAEFSAELVAPDEFSSSIELNIEEPEEVISEPSEPRTAILLRDEGSPNEVVFPFQGENYTIGRSAENNIQIKNDSKVSRKHCRLSRRSNQFFIQDLQSSNGTVVDGELIDERKLVGGEEIKVGETIFRFSIQ